jgi:hypothetical protein
MCVSFTVVIVCSLIYNKFMDDECYSNAYIFDALIKVRYTTLHYSAATIDIGSTAQLHY